MINRRVYSYGNCVLADVGSMYFRFCNGPFTYMKSSCSCAGISISPLLLLPRTIRCHAMDGWSLFRAHQRLLHRPGHRNRGFGLVVRDFETKPSLMYGIKEAASQPCAWAKNFSMARLFSVLRSMRCSRNVAARQWLRGLSDRWQPTSRYLPPS
jgi:hypothetical protein